MNAQRLTLILVLLFCGVSFRASLVEAQSDTATPSGDAPLIAESGDKGTHESSKHDGEHGGEGTHGGGSGWDTFWRPAITQTLGLILLVLVYLQWVHPLLKRVHEDRKERIQSDLETIKEEREELERREEEIDEKMASIEERAEQEREEILERGRKLKEETIEEAEEHAEETIQSAREEADRIRERAVLEIQNSMTESALSALRKYFREEAGQELHEAFHENLIDSMKEAESLDQFQRGDDDHMQESNV